MDIRKIVIMNAVCTLLFSAAFAGTASQPVGRPTESYALPLTKQNCGACHLTAGMQKAGELKKKLSSICLDCHRDHTAPTEHKVDIVPTMEVRGLPLFDGKIACPTCHDPHVNTYGRMLRIPAKDLCMACHHR